MKTHFDVVVIGAGPAGLNAVKAAARGGASVALIDDNPRPGGQIWRQGPGFPAQAPLEALLASLRESDAGDGSDCSGGNGVSGSGTPNAVRQNITYLPSTRVIAPLVLRQLLLESAEHGGLSISYRRLILATGARELLLPFPGWTLPGVTGAGGLQALIKGGMPVRGERVVIAGSGPLLIAALATAHAAGAEVLAVIEQASAGNVARFGMSLLLAPGKLKQALAMSVSSGLLPKRYWTDSMVREAQGDGRVERVTIQRGERTVMLDCDRIACGFGLVPNVTLAQALGCAISKSGEIVVDDAQRTTVDNVLAAGECTGVGGMELAAVEGEIAGMMSIASASASASALSDTQLRLTKERARWRRFARRVATTFALRDPARTPPDDATLLCRCEDIRIGDVRAFGDWREAKLHTRCGMGACQGRICGAAAAVYFGWPPAPPRPPFSPVQISTLLAMEDEASSD